MQGFSKTHQKWTKLHQNGMFTKVKLFVNIDQGQLLQRVWSKNSFWVPRYDVPKLAGSRNIFPLLGRPRAGPGRAGGRKYFFRKCPISKKSKILFLLKISFHYSEIDFENFFRPKKNSFGALLGRPRTQKYLEKSWPGPEMTQK